MNLDKNKLEIVESVIYHAISGLGLGSNDGKSKEYREIHNKFKTDKELDDNVINLYSLAVEAFLPTEIQTITGINENDVYEVQKLLQTSQKTE